jgi:hypothetical protein
MVDLWFGVVRNIFFVSSATATTEPTYDNLSSTITTTYFEVYKTQKDEAEGFARGKAFRQACRGSKFLLVVVTQKIRNTTGLCSQWDIRQIYLS